MMKYKCPHCGKETFSPWMKLRCGGMTSYGKPCPECGRRCVNGKASLNAGAKPYLSVKCAGGAASIPALKRIFKIGA